MAILQHAAPPAGPLPPLITPTTSLEQAVRGGSLGVGYGGGGFLVFYYIGISKILHQLGIIKPGSVKTAGASIGVLAQGVDHPGMPPHDEWIRKGIEFSAGCRADHDCVGSLDKHYAGLIEEMVPPHALESINGRACGVVSWYNGGKPQGGYVCNYKDRAEVVESIRVGCYVPGWSGAATHLTLQGKAAFDGAFQQLLPCPPNVTYCIKIAGLAPWNPAPSVEAALDPSAMAETLAAAMAGMEATEGSNPMDAMFNGPEGLNSLEMPGWLRLLAMAQQPIADIYPGKFSKSPLTPAQLLRYVFTPPTEAQAMRLYRLGQTDARAWAKSVGWPTLR
ncbi:MAG: hypothetical protein J3K34DRAFT_515855 [Monoraphidium minutum]|nr:MAG: hypothetical protein J3K34DRAFT_515855 [Monoraphidium minutum]